MKEHRIEYLNLLASGYPSIPAVSQEIINLSAILELPKGTEHFLSDIHGEHEAFHHVLRSGSGAVRNKIEDIFGTTLMEKEKSDLAMLIYYPERKLNLELSRVENKDEWLSVHLFRLIRLGRVTSEKYTRSKLRKSLPPQFAYILEELLHEQEQVDGKHEYYFKIIRTIISLGQGEAFITELAKLLQRLVIDHLHIIGDIYDRGPGAHIIMDTLTEYHSLDIQWGNHDVLWMGAAGGSEACICNVIRIALRYADMQTLEEGYGINMLPLATFALEVYKDSPYKNFLPKENSKFSRGKREEISSRELHLLALMQKAVTVIQMKVEARVIKRNPDFRMEDRLLLDKIDPEKKVLRIGDKVYPLNDVFFPTLDSEDPFALSREEQEVMEKLVYSFTSGEKLQKHIRLLFSRGGMYKIHNGKLLYHGCMPVDQDGSFQVYRYKGKAYRGRKFFDKIEQLVRQGYFSDQEEKQEGLDMTWYLWTGNQSPLFGKEKMATFERYFLDDKSAHKEELTPYYRLRDDRGVAESILREFGLDEKKSLIINGHVPVKVSRGEKPVKAGGKMIVIDGGFAKAYQKETGIAGYTLVFNSHKIFLVAHKPFVSAADALEKNEDTESTDTVLEVFPQRLEIKNTDIGRKLQDRITELKELLEAYKKGLITPREKL